MKREMLIMIAFLVSSVPSKQVADNPILSDDLAVNTYNEPEQHELFDTVQSYGNSVEIDSTMLIDALAEINDLQRTLEHLEKQTIRKQRELEKLTDIEHHAYVYGSIH